MQDTFRPEKIVETTVNNVAAVSDLITESTLVVFDAISGEDENRLPKDASAQWSAGFLYGASGRTIDQRDYILGCSKHCPIVDRKLSKAWAAYENGNYSRANKKMESARLPWRLSMVTCWDTNKDFHRILDRVDTFLD